MMQTATARFNMIEQQIRTWDVLDPSVLQLFNDVPREYFLPKEYIALAFADVEIPIGYDTNGQMQTMLSPKLEGRILQALNCQKQHQVLHIGTGSGYFAALLASLVEHVVSIDINPELSEIAANNLANQGIKNIDLRVADGALGYMQSNHTNRYDVIVYTASSPLEPINVRQQLNIDGVMFVIIGIAPVMQATLIKRFAENSFKETVLFETCLPALINAVQPEAFIF